MAFKHHIIRSERDQKNIISDLYQLDPAFYKKIISRNSSVRRFSHQNSICRSPGKVPFLWETQPGKPRHASADDAHNLRPPIIRFPPAVVSLTLPRPSMAIPPAGPKAYLLKNIKKVKNVQLGLPVRVHNLSMRLPNVFTSKDAKASFSKNIKKVQKIKNVGKRMKAKAKSPNTNDINDSDDGFQDYFDCVDDFAQSPTSGLGGSSSRSFPSSSPKCSAVKSPKILGFSSLRFIKWNFTKRNKEIY